MVSCVADQADDRLYRILADEGRQDQPADEVVMSKKAADQPASKMYFKPGQKLTMDSALKLLLIKSANDIAVAIAETIGGNSDNFVAQMKCAGAAPRHEFPRIT